MATITGLTAARMQQHVDEQFIDADVVSEHLILTRRNGSQVDAGPVTPIASPVATTPAELAAIVAIEGKEAYYKVSDDITWLLRYQDSTSRWMKVGGPPIFVEDNSQVDTVSTGYADLGGPSVTAPLNGSYRIEHGAEAWNNGGAGSLGTIYMSYNIGGTGAVDADAARNRPLNGAEEETLFRRTQKTLTAGQALATRYKTSSGTIRDFFRNRHIMIDPRYVTT